MTKRTYLVDDELLVQFEKLVPQGKRGAWVNKAIAQKLEEERVAEIRADIDEGLREMADIYLETEREFHALETEVDRNFNGTS